MGKDQFFNGGNPCTANFQVVLQSDVITTALYMINIYYRISKVNCSKQKPKHAHLMCKNQWGLFSHYTAHLSICQIKEVHFSLTCQGG